MRITDYKSDNHCKYSLKVHLVWTPKFRRPVLISGVDTRLEQIIRQVAKETNVEILALSIMPDHVHLLADIPPSFGVHKFIKLAKGRSSHILRSEYTWLKSRIPTLWTHSYFCSSVGGGQQQAIKDYIESQKV